MKVDRPTPRHCAVAPPSSSHAVPFNATEKEEFCHVTVVKLPRTQGLDALARSGRVKEDSTSAELTMEPPLQCNDREV